MNERYTNAFSAGDATLGGDPVLGGRCGMDAPKRYSFLEAQILPFRIHRISEMELLCVTPFLDTPRPWGRVKDAQLYRYRNELRGKRPHLAVD